jgi:hypothetical protein
VSKKPTEILSPDGNTQEEQVGPSNSIRKLAFEEQCWNLRAREYLSSRAIAERLGSSPSAVTAALNRAAEKHSTALREKVETTLGLELERVDDVSKKLYNLATEGDVKAAEALVKLMDYRAKVVGLFKERPIMLVPVSLDTAGMSDDELRTIAGLKAKIQEVERPPLLPAVEG